ncbi:MAG: secA [Rickettsiaceae bacterium]|jgi:preprotein translocase subunit SecA|nr:secA [Rickettsiaceae bacterium]
MLGFIAKKIFGSVNDRVIKSLAANVEKINAFEPSISALSDEALKAKTEEFKNRLKNGETVDQILCEAFAVAREASKRVLGMRHFDVQLIGGMILHQGKISEMRTGEGKTLVATLPSYLNALAGEGVHVVTTNDYLVQRDAAWMGKIHQFLGLSVGCVTNELDDEQRKAAYNCDITYATNNELGFDYLRDNMKYSLEDMVQRGHHFAIVDEVDSILVDEARTPLIISGPTNDNSKLYDDINRLIPLLKEGDFQIEEKERNVFLTEEGIETVEKLLKQKNLIEQDSGIYDVHNIALVHHVNQALKAHKIFKNEIDYIVKDNSVIIIDEFTGRMQEGRRFSDGLHQALEAKEGVKIRNENQTLASITFQNYFRLYKKLSGMTGTAATEAVEFEEIYGLKVVEIPTNRPISRIDEDDEIYKSEAEKYKAIVKVIEDRHKNQQPMLVGTVSIEKSEYLSKLLTKHKIPHKVLNAKYHEKEAHIISQAGVPGAITIATNMAGRGTDIMLGGNPEMLIEEARAEISDENALNKKIAEIKAKIEENKKIAIEAGGLYVLGTERHESRRIDNQLRGRSGRQGDPGKSKFYISLEDDLMRIFGSERLQGVLSRLGLKDDEAIFHPWITRTLAGAQHKVEMRNYEIRKNLLKYDDVVNQQRKAIFEKRMKLILAGDVSAEIENIREEINEDIVGKQIPKNSYPEEWGLEDIENELQRIYGLKLEIKAMGEKEGISDVEILEFVQEKTKQLFIKRKEIYGEMELQLQKQLFLATLDEEWKDHLCSLDKLRHSINLRAYAQKDPLMEYKREAYNLFEAMMLQIEEKTLSRIAHAQLKMDAQKQAELDILKQMAAKQKMFESRVDPNMPNFDGAGTDQGSRAPVKSNIAAKDRNPADSSSWGNVGRNELCPCGSGKKYKHCHG